MLRHHSLGAAELVALMAELRPGAADDPRGARVLAFDLAADAAEVPGLQRPGPRPDADPAAPAAWPG